MFEKIKRILFGKPRNDEADDDPDAGVRVPVKPGPPDRTSSVAVAEPDED